MARAGQPLAGFAKRASEALKEPDKQRVVLPFVGDMAAAGPTEPTLLDLASRNAARLPESKFEPRPAFDDARPRLTGIDTCKQRRRGQTRTGEYGHAIHDAGVAVNHWRTVRLHDRVSERSQSSRG
jgi:hypothetical protein